MTYTFSVRLADSSASPEIAPLVGELLAEITTVVGSGPLGFALGDATDGLADLLTRGKLLVLVARDEDGKAAGFLSMCEGYALYAGGAIGTITELYVRPEYRSMGLGSRLLDTAKLVAATRRGWVRLEVTTPPLPQFDRTLAFYEREGFTVTGGRKLKAVL